MVLIELLAATDGAPWNQLVNVGITCVIRHLFTLNAGPSRRGDDFARLLRNMMEVYFFILFRLGQMSVVAISNFDHILSNMYFLLNIRFLIDYLYGFRCIYGSI